MVKQRGQPLCIRILSTDTNRWPIMEHVCPFLLKTVQAPRGRLNLVRNSRLCKSVGPALPHEPGKKDCKMNIIAIGISWLAGKGLLNLNTADTEPKLGIRED